MYNQQFRYLDAAAQGDLIDENHANAAYGKFGNAANDINQLTEEIQTIQEELNEKIFSRWRH